MEGDATAAVTGRPSARLSADDHCLQRIRLDSIVRDGAGSQQSLPVWRAIVMGACMLPRISLSWVKIHRVWLKLSARGGRIIPARGCSFDQTRCFFTQDKDISLVALHAED